MSKKPKLSYHWEPRGANTWRITVSAGFAPDGTRRRYTATIHAPTEQEMHVQALAYAAQMRSAPTVIERKPAPALTVSGWVSQWLREHVAVHLSPRTYGAYAAIMRNRVIPSLGKIPLEKLEPRHVAEWVQILAEPTVRIRKLTGRPGTISGSTQLRAYRVLSACLQEAVYRHLIPTNPARAVRPPRAERGEARFYDERAVTSLLDALNDEPARVRAMILLAVGMGLRRGEIMALTWEQIDLDAKVLHVAKSAAKVRAMPQAMKPTKTRGSVRTLSIPAPVAQALTEWQDEQRALRATREAMGRRWLDGDNGHIFTRSVTGRWWHVDEVNKQWYKFLARHPDVPRINFHGLRHTVATLLLSAGVPVRTVSAHVGHASAKMTLDTYAHVMRSTEDTANLALEAALSPKTVTKSRVG